MSASTPHADVEQGRGIAAAWLRKNPTKAPTEEEVEMAAAYLVSRSARVLVQALVPAKACLECAAAWV